MDIDEIEKELKRAAKAIELATTHTVAYKARLESLCDSAAPEPKKAPESEEDAPMVHDAAVGI